MDVLRAMVRTAESRIYRQEDTRPMAWPFGKKEEEPVENKMPEQSERQLNLYWMIRMSPFKDYSDEEIQAAIDQRLKEFNRTLRSKPAEWVVAKTQRKVDKLEAVSGDRDAIAAERDQAILHFNRNMLEDNGGVVPTDPARISATVSREGWVDNGSPVDVEGMPHCPRCGYINRRAKHCVNCGARIKLRPYPPIRMRDAGSSAMSSYSAHAWARP